ncbi:MAG: sigma-70 family RNA polymerase sigma factor [Phycisphaerae bacterium]|jgi:RNA polymerase sigma-70 factor (ECF subfamily)|nr:sigma-70 family RNA polymerase sigma factor [Phycisphaerae bacterium]
MALRGANSTDTDRLIQSVRKGDREALERLLARHRPALRRFLEIRLDSGLRQRVDPSDAVQETQAEAARRIEAYLRDGTMPFAIWLRRIAYDRLIMLRRRHMGADCRAATRDLPLPDRSSVDLGRHVLAHSATPSEQLVRRELGERVRQSIAGLDEDDRELILMRNYEGLSNLEVAQVLDIDPPTASKRYGRALLRLRAVLMSCGFTESLS